MYGHLCGKVIYNIIFPFSWCTKQEDWEERLVLVVRHLLHQNPNLKNSMNSIVFVDFVEVNCTLRRTHV